MRMFFIIYDADSDEEVMQLLGGCNVLGFTKWDRVLIGSYLWMKKP